MHYALLFMLCSLFDVISHAFKESIVRTKPVNQEKFNFHISLAQLIVGIAISPLVLSVSKEYEDYHQLPFKPDEKTLPDFMKWYFSEGFKCLFMVSDENPQC